MYNNYQPVYTLNQDRMGNLESMLEHMQPYSIYSEEYLKDWGIDLDFYSLNFLCEW